MKKKSEVQEAGHAGTAGPLVPDVKTADFSYDQKSEFVEKIVKRTRDFNARTKRNETTFDEKAFVDGLYGDL